VKADRLASLPDYPGVMGEDLAATYLGVSRSTFRSRVRAGAYPQPCRDGRRVLWARRQLDSFIAARFGLPDAGAEIGGESDGWADFK
jgi:predicted DNA-binding transcriptional regulator AlpA